jgi:predicted O-linked N-acetylglucosamine transferase (SPINDLY family)
VYGTPLPTVAARRPGKLRIGYLSGDVRNHVMGKMMWAAIQHHDRERFEIYCYSVTSDNDELTESYRGFCHRFEVVGELSDRAAAEHIAADDLDVLVDLSTHTKNAKPGVLALKPARVQITHVATMARSRCRDRFKRPTPPPTSTTIQAAIEPPLVMDGCVYPYRHITPATADLFTRERLRGNAAAVLIGAFCTPLKLSQRCLALWRDVLRRIPDALLAFSPLRASLRPVFAHICTVGGIDAARIVFVPQGRDDAENQARYRLIDFVLDPMPYGGVNGTLEALDMGVPVVTLVGRRHAERTSYSILTNLGVTETIAQTGGGMSTSRFASRPIRRSCDRSAPASPMRCPRRR